MKYVAPAPSLRAAPGGVGGIDIIGALTSFPSLLQVMQVRLSKDWTSPSAWCVHSAHNTINIFFLQALQPRCQRWPPLLIF